MGRSTGTAVAYLPGENKVKFSFIRTFQSITKVICLLSMYDAMCLITRLLVKKVPRTLLVPPDSIEQSVQHGAVYECSPTTTGTTTEDPVQNEFVELPYCSHNLR